MVALNTALYVLTLLSAHLASTAAFQALPGYTPRLPRAINAGISSRAQSLPQVRRDGKELQLGSSSSSITRRQESNEGKPAGSGRQTLIEVAGTYTLPVIIGTPPNAYPLQLDLASSDIILASTLCTGSSCPAGLGDTVNPYYGFTSSSTLTNVTGADGRSIAWSTRYSDRTAASGFAVKETIEIAGIVAENVTLGIINATNITLSEQRISGILGLAFPRLSTLARVSLHNASATTNNTRSASVSAANSSASSRYLPPLLETLATHLYLQYPLFALALNDTNPSLTLGGVSANYTSLSNATDGRRVEDIEWVQVVPFGPAVDAQQDLSVAPTLISSSVSSSSTGSQPSSSASSSTAAMQSQVKRAVPSTLAALEDEAYLYWAIQLRNISVNGTDIPLNSTYSDLGLGSVALLDLGANGIYGPAQDVINIFSAIPESRQVSEGQWAVPCETRMTIGFSFGGRYITLQPSDWMSGRVVDSQMCLAWPVALPATGDGLDWQLGTPFLKRVYTIYSYGIDTVQAPLVGFLPMTHMPSPSLSPSSSSAASASIFILSSASASISASVSALSASSADPLSPTPTFVQNASQITSNLATTFTTQLPNILLPNPTYTTPAYAFSSAPLLQVGVIQTMGLGNASAYTIMPPPTVVSTNVSANTTSTRSVGGVGDSMGSTSPSGDTLKTITAGKTTFVIFIAVILHLIS